MVSQFRHIANFVVVYIEEAHPNEEWHFDAQKYKMNQHSCLNERLDAVQLLNNDLEDKAIPLLVDLMSNKANFLYGAVPERLVIIEQGCIKYISRKGPYGFAEGLVEIETKLKQMV